MAQPQAGDRVLVHYTGKLGDGQVFDSSRDRDPMELIIGSQHVIPGFEQTVVNLSPGQSDTVTIKAEEAYGSYHEELVRSLDRSKVPPDISLEVGKTLAIGQGKESMRVKVTELTEETVTIDANHPLAGQALTFDIELVEILARETED